MRIETWNYDRQTNWPTGRPTNQPNDERTDRQGHRKVSLPIKGLLLWINRVHIMDSGKYQSIFWLPYSVDILLFCIYSVNSWTNCKGYAYANIHLCIHTKCLAYIDERKHAAKIWACQWRFNRYFTVLKQVLRGAICTQSASCNI